MNHLLTTALALTLLLAGCDAYNDLPLQQRERAVLSVEHSALYAGASGVLQVVADLPVDAAGPVVVVGIPVSSSSASLRVDGYSVGACPGQSAPSDGRLRLCVAATVGVGARPEIPPQLGLVVEARSSARRFNVAGDVTLP
ncbi:MAG: hypothetical protein R3F39_04710 [Myxococcota bacterium]